MSAHLFNCFRPKRTQRERSHCDSPDVSDVEGLADGGQDDDGQPGVELDVASLPQTDLPPDVKSSILGDDSGQSLGNTVVESLKQSIAY